MFSRVRVFVLVGVCVLVCMRMCVCGFTYVYFAVSVALAKIVNFIGPRFIYKRLMALPTVRSLMITPMLITVTNDSFAYIGIVYR